MTVSDALTLYKWELARLSEQSQVWYIPRIQRFAEWCESEGVSLEQVKSIHTRQYIEHLRSTPSSRGTPLASTTVHGHARAIRAFLRWCHREEGMEEMVTEKAARVTMPKIVKKVMSTYTPKELQDLMRVTDQEVYPELRLRSHAIVVMLVDTGIRAGELVGLTMDHLYLHPTGSHIRVMGKGSKEREVGLGKVATRELRKYLQVRKAVPGEDHVFLTRSHAPMTVTGLDQVITRLAGWANIDDAHPHKFRHTFARSYLEAGGDLFSLARLMGHSSVEVTSIYLEGYTSEQARKKGISVLDRIK